VGALGGGVGGGTGLMAPPGAPTPGPGGRGGIGPVGALESPLHGASVVGGDDAGTSGVTAVGVVIVVAGAAAVWAWTGAVLALGFAPNRVSRNPTSKPPITRTRNTPAAIMTRLPLDCAGGAARGMVCAGTGCTIAGTSTGGGGGGAPRIQGLSGSPRGGAAGSPGSAGIPTAGAAPPVATGPTGIGIPGMGSAEDASGGAAGKA
jgi:hypothetical protein